MKCADFAAVTTALEWVQVSAFYANLERSARAIRPNQGLTAEDVSLCAAIEKYAEEAAPLAGAHVARNEDEEGELIAVLTASSETAAGEVVDHELDLDGRRT